MEPTTSTGFLSFFEFVNICHFSLPSLFFEYVHHAYDLCWRQMMENESIKMLHANVKSDPKTWLQQSNGMPPQFVSYQGMPPPLPSQPLPHHLQVSYNFKF
jgi:hypothetical protein